MTSIQALRERLAALSKTMNKQLADKGDAKWSKEDQATFDANGEQAESLQQQIAAHERVMQLDRENNFEDGILDHILGNGSRAPKASAAALAAKEGFELYLRKGFGHNAQVGQLTAEELLKVKNTMSTTTGSQGGFGVMPLVATSFIDLLKSWGYMRKVAESIKTENGADLSYPTSDGTAELGEIIAQNVTATSLDPSFGTVPVNTFKFGSKVVAVPIELLQDAQFDITSMVTNRLRDRIGRIQNQKFTIGTGTGEPFGLTVTAPIGKTGLSGQTLTVIYDDLVDLVDSLDAAYLDVPMSMPQMAGVDPGWMFSQATRRIIRKIKDTAGRPIWTPSYDDGATAVMPDRLLGYPVYINNDMPVMAANAKSIAFGNLHRYLIRDAMEVTMFRFDDSAYMKLGQVGFLAWARAGGNLLDLNAVKCYQNSAT